MRFFYDMKFGDDLKSLLKSGLSKIEKQIQLLDELTQHVKELNSTLKKTNALLEALRK